MKTLATIILSVLFVATYAQKEDYKILLDSAKSMFKREKGLRQEELDKFDYDGVAAMFQKVIDLKPDDAEAHYFLGYTYSRINSRDGRSMIGMSLGLVKKTSEQFEIVNKLMPKYTKEIVVLDPYSKLTSEWGAMAMSYWHNNQPDSAVWAFREGKKRGGFGNFILDLNKKVLDACSPNAILISSGDNFTIPLWYLQIAEGYRKDVTVVDISLLNTTWYPAYLSKNKAVGFDLPDAVLDTMEYTRWNDSAITIGKFTWTVKPTYYDQYLLRGDRVFLSLLKQNKFQRDVYFTIAFQEDCRLSLKEHLSHLTIADKLETGKIREQTFEQYKKSNEALLRLSDVININSPDELVFFDSFRYNLLDGAYNYLTNNEKKKGKELIGILDKYGAEQRIPYQSKEGRVYVRTIRQMFGE
ncbi:MAG: hypothetical protein JST26_08115 [Bacteroidetes bacterium]|nr:hypothetical protein [Bacteroidota bacterium]